MKAFRVKNLLNILPTYFHFYNITPEIYQANTCFFCNSQDSSTHWLNCHSSQTLNQIINLSIAEIINKHFKDLTITQRKAIIDLIKSHPSFNYSPALPLHTHQLYATM